MNAGDDLPRRLSAAHAEALQVGDSPLRADRLAEQLPAIAALSDRAEIGQEIRGRMRDALALAERVLRRDDDGREAARHLRAALDLLEPRPRKASPFLDEE